MSKYAKKKPAGWKRLLLTCLCVVLAVILVASLAVTIVLSRVWNSLENMETLNTETLSPDQLQNILKETDPVAPDFTGPVVNPDDITTPPPPEYQITGENIINIMLIGQDRRPGEIRARSDAMILVTINKSKRTMTFTSFMRDMYVHIPGWGGDKMNMCYQLNGAPLLNRCMQESFGLEVDGNVEVDFEGFMGVIDVLGGIDIELSAAEADYMNRNSYNPDFADEPWQVKEGVNHLDGGQALAYSRIRYVNAELGDGSVHNYADYGRTGRQRKVMMAIFQRVLDMGLSDINKVLPLVDKITQNVATDLSKEQIIQYATEILPIMGQLKIQNLRIPADDTFYSANVDGKDALVPDLEANREILKDALS